MGNKKDKARIRELKSIQVKHLIKLVDTLTSAERATREANKKQSFERTQKEIDYRATVSAYVQSPVLCESITEKYIDYTGQEKTKVLAVETEKANPEHISLSTLNKRLDKLKLGIEDRLHVMNSRKDFHGLDRNFVGNLTGNENLSCVTIDGEAISIVESSGLLSVVGMVSRRMDTVSNRTIYKYICLDGFEFETYQFLTETHEMQSKTLDTAKGYRSQMPVLVTKNADYEIAGNLVEFDDESRLSTNLVNQSYDAQFNFSDSVLIRSGKKGGKKLSSKSVMSVTLKAKKAENVHQAGAIDITKYSAQDKAIENRLSSWENIRQAERFNLAMQIIAFESLND